MFVSWVTDRDWVRQPHTPHNLPHQMHLVKGELGSDGVAKLERTHKCDPDLPWVVKTASGVELMEFKEELENK